MVEIQAPKTVLKKSFYEKELARLQIELVRLQHWVQAEGKRIVVLFEGRDAAGKGGSIKRITQRLNPRIAKVVALGIPTEREQSQWYFQRYVAHLPAAGEIVLFDRSWYNRAGVERVMGFCSEPQVQEFFRSCPEFEKMLSRSGIQLIKYWFSVSADEQAKRLNKRILDPTRRWKISPMDLKSREQWHGYTRARDDMFLHTDTEASPWWVVKADSKRKARLNVIAHLLEQIPYQHVKLPQLSLPDVQPLKDGASVNPPTTRWVPEVY